MKAFLRRLLSRKSLAGFAIVALLLAGLSMLHPYPRQSLFGPTIRGKPRCVWETQIRRQVTGEQTFLQKWFGWANPPREILAFDAMFDDAEMLPIVLSMLEDDNELMRSTGLMTVGTFPNLQDRAALPALRKHLESEDLACRMLAVRAIWMIDKDQSVIPIALKPLDDPDPGVRAAAMNHLISLAPHAPDLYPQFVARLKDPNQRVRAPIMYAMSAFGKKGVPILRDGMNDPHAEVRLAAVISAESLGPAAKELCPALEMRLGDSDPDVRSLASAVLQRMEPERYKHLKVIVK